MLKLSRNMRAVLVIVGVVATASFAAAAGQDQSPRPTFRASVDRVAVTAVVRTREGRPVTDLTHDEFELFDTGEPRTIVEVRSDSTPVRVGLLIDFSGSMSIAAKRDAATDVAHHILSWLEPGVDEAGLFAFDSRLLELHPLAPAPGEILDRLTTISPYGTTSLFDAIAEAGRRLAADGGARRAIVALTDGLDNASQLTAEDVSALASAIDVPVYIVLIVSPLDQAGDATLIDDRLDAMTRGSLGNLARWTGGEIFTATGPAPTSTAARQIVDELRHQYLIAFEPGERPGWHPIEVRATRRNVIVRTRSGYVVPARPADQ
jgi:Ca-activated chloride channel family protein